MNSTTVKADLVLVPREDEANDDVETSALPMAVEVTVYESKRVSVYVRLLESGWRRMTGNLYKAGHIIANDGKAFYHAGPGQWRYA